MKRNGLISVIIWCFVSCSFVGRAIGQTCSESNKRNTEALPSATVSLQSYSSPGWRVTYYP
uniref:Uncharacterized protein n=1 Tax=Magallana gigas TaxID=29159 RepID=K1REE4_MAGGI